MKYLKTGFVYEATTALREYLKTRGEENSKFLFWQKIQNLKEKVIVEYQKKLNMSYQDAFQNFVNGDYKNMNHFKDFISKIERINKLKEIYFPRNTITIEKHSAVGVTEAKLPIKEKRLV